jgi:hypothetical protein
MVFTVQDIINEGRDDSYVTVNQVDNVLWLRFFNRVHHDVENAIVTKLWDNYFSKVTTITMLPNINTYYLPQGSSQTSNYWFKKIKSVDMQYDTSPTSREYVKATPMDISWLQTSVTWYDKNQSAQFPTYRIINDNEIQIFPTPKIASVNGVRIEYTYEYADKDLTDGENSLHIPWQLVKALYPIGIAMYIFQSRGLTVEKQEKKADYEKELKKWLIYLADRESGPVEQKLPNLRSFMY